MARSRSKYSRMFLVVIALVVIIVLWGLIKRVQVLRSEASIPGNIGEVKASVERVDTDLQRVSFSFHTGVDEEDSEIVSYLSIRIEIPLAGGLVLLTDETGLQTHEVIVAEEFINEDNWNVLVNKIHADGEMLYVDFALVNLTKDGFKSNELKHFADFYIKKGVVPVEITLNVNKDYSFMYTKDRPVVNIWEPPASLVVIR